MPSGPENSSSSLLTVKFMTITRRNELVKALQKDGLNASDV